MLFVLRALSSWFSQILQGRSPSAPAPVLPDAARRQSSHRTAVVAMVANGDDRQVLIDVSSQQGLPVHFVESPEEALTAIELLRAPAALVDRNWPGSNWRTVVEELSSSEVRPCVILLSGVLDERLWAEVVGRGGYEVLAKPLQAEQAVRVIKLALSYQQAASRTLLRARVR